MWILIKKSDLHIEQIFEETYQGYDTDIYYLIEQDISLLDMCYLKAVDNDGVISIIEDAVTKTAVDKSSRIAALNVQTWATIMDEAKGVYGSDDPVLVLASHSTYQDMMDHPAAYVGEIFADQATVTAYAEPKLAASSAFGKWRLGILAAEAAQKAAILAE